jgi:hypothetical protein
VEKYYYDSCVFGNSLNPQHAEYSHCRCITDPASIDWPIVIFRDLVVAETTFGQLVDEFEIQCALNGVIIQVISVAEERKSARRIRQHKRPLSRFGLIQRDWRHICAALCASARFFVTTDPDFFDPSNKSVRGGSRVCVSKYLSDNLSITVILPSIVSGGSSPHRTGMARRRSRRG